MLVRFVSSECGEIVMLAKTARQLLEIAGKEPAARGVFTEDQLLEAQQKLQAAVAAAPREAAADPSDDSGKNDGAPVEPEVPLARRAWPLIEMLGRTHHGHGFVTWEAPGDF